MTSSDLPDLQTCLSMASWRRLLAIMSSHGLPCSTRWSKDQLVAALYAHLIEPTNLTGIVHNLSDQTRSVLRVLLEAGGTVPAQKLQDTFGTVQTYRPWRKETAQVSPPWLAPTSPVERLWYLGLLHWMPPKPKPGLLQRAVVPADLLPVLQGLLMAEHPGQPTHLYRRPGRTPDLRWHAAIFLATLTGEHVRLRHGKWLAPSLVTLLVQRIGLDSSPDYRPRRSERHLPYLAFVHHLAAAAGLTTVVGQQLTTSARGWQWLGETVAQRQQALWHAWLHADVEQTECFAFPASRLAPKARDLVVSEIARLSVAEFCPLAAVVQQVHLQDHSQLLMPRWNETGDVVAKLVAGPLFWLGVVDMAGETGGEIPFASPVKPTEEITHDLEGRRDGLQLAEQHRLMLRLTPQGAWLLGLPDFGPPTTKISPCVTPTREPDLVTVPPDSQPLHLARLARFSDWLLAEGAAPDQRLQLTAGRIGQAAAQGTAPAQILHALEDACGRPASRRQAQRVRRWAEAGRKVRIRRLTVLQTEDAALMGKLRSHKVIRRHLGDALSPTRSVVNPAGLPSLAAALRALDLFVAAPVQPGGADESKTDDLARALYLAGLVYEGLGEHVPLSMPLSGDVLDHIAARLDDQERQAAEFGAQQALEQVAAALRGYLGLPAWQAQSDQAAMVQAIEAALARQQDVVLTYWGAGREQAVVRRVTPYWTERRKNVLYLVGYCHLRSAERVFRLDRIVACASVARDD